MRSQRDSFTRVGRRAQSACHAQWGIEGTQWRMIVDDVRLCATAGAPCARRSRWRRLEHPAGRGWIPAVLRHIFGIAANLPRV